jgi:hypothetical protein
MRAPTTKANGTPNHALLVCTNVGTHDCCISSGPNTAPAYPPAMRKPAWPRESRPV